MVVASTEKGVDFKYFITNIVVIPGRREGVWFSQMDLQQWKNSQRHSSSHDKEGLSSAMDSLNDIEVALHLIGAVKNRIKRD